MRSLPRNTKPTARQTLSSTTIAEQQQQSTTDSILLLPGFSKPGLPLPSLVQFYSECILRGLPDAKEPAAQGLAECVALSSGPCIQPCVIKILGPMIRLLGERQPSTVKAAMVESLATLIEKVSVLQLITRERGSTWSPGPCTIPCCNPWRRRATKPRRHHYRCLTFVVSDVDASLHAATSSDLYQGPG